MDDPSVESRAVDVFEMRLADIETVDVAQLLALSIAVRWPHRAADWQFMRSQGRGLVALDEIGRVCGSAMWFPYTETFAAVGMVITSPRLQALGTGSWLMTRVIAECGGRALRLNATNAAYRLYSSLGFQRERTLYQCQGKANGAAASSVATEGVRLLAEAELPSVIENDAQAYGVARAKLITALFQRSHGYGLFRSGRLAAFALCRPLGRGHVIGPVVASCDTDAIAVIAPHVAAHSRQFLRLDTHSEGDEFRAFIAGAGLALHDTVTTMSLRPHGAEPPTGGSSTCYAVVSQAFG
ncbi:GNAT family N-acetyltransferase [Bradyrhizobium sp. 83012]|uniref:GNAT family N-acetyltransferase n=1 Tax=Bradyrhizobium aeschynomenes TaxID=2734909 RepID=A0ABX2CJB5_9BRAD|nr:GNAT family N-acetyltransferase [Bradyrhizobium aeschynomenes]NPU15418.1 GNAT family N-acetyltransferase [Bradyrhizobium aeschynomenes]NPU68273.1 GNAT family N-acetyltransferase [Bradyrhizobium aeschynomenes]NPV25563.1 GNAT family N-acetyltransferase [Bradyrhizobium aeschynomenes]